ncbi:MAG: hypothetical protein AAF171_01415 [Cyanobacteria bacterium P01_A01_bin.116]
MKRKFMFGLGIAALVATAPLAVSTPVLASLQTAGEAIAQRLTRPEVTLEMGVEKQIIIVDDKGQEKTEWQRLEGEASVLPGDVLRYAVASSNAGDIAAENLVVNQPIPAAMTYVIGSEKGNSAADATYSIDNGATFVKEPMVEVTLPDGTVEMQPAPATAYTHVKWNFSESLEASEVISVSHEVIVK